MLAEQPCHLLGTLQAALLIREEQRWLVASWLSGLFERDAMADRRDDVLEARSLPGCVVNVVGGDAAQAEHSRYSPQGVVTESLVRQEMSLRLDKEVVGPE